MKEKKLTVLLIVLVIVVVGVIVTAIIFYYVFNRGITALEGKKIADKVAAEWDPDAFLIYVIATGEVHSDGRAESWDYLYRNQNRTSELNVCVSSDGKVETNEYIGCSSYFPIINWSIDSDTAYKIALQNEKINVWLSEYKHASIEDFSLMRWNCSNNPVWSIDWIDWGFMDNPHSAYIIIDAHTGEVLKVEAQMD